jgi:hypothetical protein
MVITLFDTMQYTDLVLWAEEFDIHHPVVLDQAATEGRNYNPDGRIPSMTLLAPGAEIVILDQDNISEEQILPYLQ